MSPMNEDNSDYFSDQESDGQNGSDGSDGSSLEGSDVYLDHSINGEIDGSSNDDEDDKDDQDDGLEDGLEDGGGAMDEDDEDYCSSTDESFNDPFRERPEDRSPADYTFLNSYNFNDEDGPIDPSDRPEILAKQLIQEAETSIRECMEGQKRLFRERCSITTTNIESDSFGSNKDAMKKCINPQDRRMATALVFKRHQLPMELLPLVDSFATPPPMPPPAMEPLPDAYLCEIHVYFRPGEDADEDESEDDDDSVSSSESVESERSKTDRKDGHEYFRNLCTNRRNHCYNSSNRDSPFVCGLLLRYSDGSYIQTGSIRRAFCPEPVILMMGEHVAGIKEITNSSWDDAKVIGLNVYGTDENELCRKFEVTPKSVSSEEWDFFSRTPGDSSVIAEGGSVVHSITWCTERRRIVSHTTKPTPNCPNPHYTDDVHQGRVAGFSHYPYRNGELVDDFWRTYVKNEHSLWYNFVPEHIRPELEKINVQKDLISVHHRFLMQWEDLVAGGIHEFRCSKEVEGICLFFEAIAKSSDVARKSKYRRSLKTLFEALKRRVKRVCYLTKGYLNVSRWCAQYSKESRRGISNGSTEETCKQLSTLADVNKELTNLLEKHNLSETRCLRACSLCFNHSIFDPRHVPTSKRCVHPGCCSDELPYCGNHVSICKYCYDPVCKTHLIDSNDHKNLCQETLSQRCGWRGLTESGKVRSLDVSCCGKFVNSQKGTEIGKTCNGEECGVLCCKDCSVPCQGWDRECRCLPPCEGQNENCRFSHNECPDKSVWCKPCSKSGVFRFSGMKCDACKGREQEDTDLEDSDYMEDSISESDSELDVDDDIDFEIDVGNK